MHGQVLKAEPLSKAIEHIFDTIGKKVPVVYMSPRGQTLTQEMSEGIVENIDEMIILCGHYEGIDERIIKLYVNKNISL